MGKNEIRGYIIEAIIFVVFTLVVFAPPFRKTSVFWLAYIFGVIAIVFQIYVFKISFSNGDGVRSKFYGFPIARVGVIYLAIQLVLSLIEICLASIIPVWVAIILNILPLAFALIGCIAAEVMRDEIVRQDITLKKDVSNMRALQSLSLSLVGLCQDESLKADLQKLADEFKYSDPVSSDQTKGFEIELMNQLNELQKAVIDGDSHVVSELAKREISALAERNRLCSLNK